MKRILIAAAGLALGIALVSASTAPPAEAFSGEIFEIVGGGAQTHFESQPAPGKKAFVNKLKTAAIVGCIAGTNPADGCAGFMENDAGGKAYVFFDSLTSWRISTHLNGSNAMTLHGLVDGAGNFMFAGTHAKSGAEVVLSGKVKFAKGSYTPTGLSGKVVGVSNLTNHFVSGTFKTVGAKQVL
jgi:hypothetical protein